jgi:hypothetical protein
MPWLNEQVNVCAGLSSLINRNPGIPVEYLILIVCARTRFFQRRWRIFFLLRYLVVSTLQ